MEDSEETLMVVRLRQASESTTCLLLFISGSIIRINSWDVQIGRQKQFSFEVCKVAEGTPEFFQSCLLSSCERLF